MKLNGVKIEGVNVEEIFIPRGDDAIHLTARAIDSYDEHDSLNPYPKPIRGKNRKGETIDIKDSNYDKVLEAFASRRGAYTIIKSLMSGTEGFEWETVNINDPNTWENWQTELTSSGFSQPEIIAIIQGVNTACGLNEAKVEEARKRFLIGRQSALEEQLFPREEPSTLQSGELVSG